MFVLVLARVLMVLMGLRITSFSVNPVVITMNLEIKEYKCKHYKDSGFSHTFR